MLSAAFCQAETTVGNRGQRRCMQYQTQMSAFRLTFGVTEIVGVGVRWGWGVNQFLNSICSQLVESFRLFLHWTNFLDFSLSASFVASR